MVRKCLRVSVCAMVLLFCSARSASAGEWDFLWWLEGLSGPGPFHGWRITEPLLCYGVKATDRTQAFTLETGEPELFFSELTCGKASRRRVWVKVAVRFGRATGDNNLQYGATLNDDQRKVTLWDFAGVVDVSLRPYLDVGTSLGVLHFTGKPSDTLDFGFSKVALEPIRLTFRPLAIGERFSTDWREVLEFRYTSTIVPEGFDDTDFLAAPGSFSTNKEFQSSFSVVFNFAPLLDRALKR